MKINLDSDKRIELGELFSRIKRKDIVYVSLEVASKLGVRIPLSVMSDLSSIPKLYIEPDVTILRLERKLEPDIKFPVS